MTDTILIVPHLRGTTRTGPYNRLLYDESWLLAAYSILAQDYTPAYTTEEYNVVPCFFEKPGHNPLYLVLDLDTRVWYSTDYESKPAVFGIGEAAAHLGLSIASLKTCVYTDAANPLVPDIRIGKRNAMLFIDSTLVKWSEQRRENRAKTDDTDILTPFRLRNVLVSGLNDGALDIETLVQRLTGEITVLFGTETLSMSKNEIDAGLQLVSETFIDAIFNSSISNLDIARTIGHANKNKPDYRRPKPTK